MRIEFSVSGLPPKKGAANSMWRLRSEIPRIKALRRAARQAMGNLPLAKAVVQLRLRLYAEPRVGDLDNFVTGVCDGLMPADPKVRWDEADWAQEEPAIRPDRAIVYMNDALVNEIHAERLRPDPAGRSYEVVVEFE